jgi:hypothetical protein
MAALVARLPVGGARALFWSVGAAAGEGARLQVRVTDGTRFWAGSLGTEDLNSVVSDEKTEGCTLAQKARHWCSTGAHYLFKLDDFAAEPRLIVQKQVGVGHIGVASIKLAEAGDSVRAAGMVELLTCCVDAVASQAELAEKLQNSLTDMKAAFDRLRKSVGDKNQILAAERDNLAFNFLAVLNDHKKEMRKLRRKLKRLNVSGLGEMYEEEEAEAENDSDSDSDDHSQASRHDSDEEAEQDEHAIGAGKLAPSAAAAAKSATPANEQRPDKKAKTATAAQGNDTELEEAKKIAPLNWFVERSDTDGGIRYNLNVYCVVQDTASAPLHYAVRRRNLPTQINEEGLPLDVISFVDAHGDVGVELHFNTNSDERDMILAQAKEKARKREQALKPAASTNPFNDVDGLFPF